MCGEDDNRHHSSRSETEHCRCTGGRPRHFLKPCLLLLLGENPAHGYELMERLEVFGFEPDPGAVYRNLRQMETDKLVLSGWDTKNAGPAKRIYRLTAEGEDLLHTWIVNIKRNKKALEDFLTRYDKHFAKKHVHPKGGV